MTERRLPQTAVENLVEDLASKANADLSNLDATGQAKFDAKADIDLTNSPYTTNRILEIPQDIKLELNNGTLTLKAGSKVYDGTGYSWVTQTDMTRTLTGNTAYMFVVEKDSSKSHFYPVSKGYSQNTQPTDIGVWFNTDTKATKWSNDGITWADCSLPIGIVTVSNNAISSIDQVFNGFGYIGSTAFVLPGVKYEYSIDVNPDGSYVNQIWTNPSVKVYTTSNTATTYSNLTIAINPTTNIAGNPYVDAYGYHYTAYTPYKYPSTGTAYWFNPATGKTLTISSSGVVGTTAYGILSFGIHRNAGKIDWIEDISINPVNTYSRSELSGLGMPSNRYIDLTLGASGSTYTAPANGWVCVGGSTSTGYYQVNNALYKIRLRSGTAEGLTSMVFPVRKGQQYVIEYNSITQHFWYTFVYAEGEQ